MTLNLICGISIVQFVHRLRRRYYFNKLITSVSLKLIKPDSETMLLFRIIIFIFLVMLVVNYVRIFLGYLLIIV